jgi:hypothetical protein
MKCMRTLGLLSGCAFTGSYNSKSNKQTTLNEHLMYEDLEQIAKLRLGKERESISKQTNDRVKEAQHECAALTNSSGMRSGQHDASIGRLQIDGAERLVRKFSEIWIHLIKQRRGRISHNDIAFVMGKIDPYARTQKGHLHKTFSHQRMGAVVNLLTQEAEMRMHATAADIRRDLQIMVREYDAFPNRTSDEMEYRMAQMPKTRFSPGRRVLVGRQSRPGTILSVDDQPSNMGEFRHMVTLDREGQTIAVLGCDLQALPGLDEDLTAQKSTTFNGDQIINYGPVGAVGRGAQGVVNVSDRLTGTEQGVDFQLLAAQLEKLRNEYRKTAASREDDKQVALLAGAADAAEKGDGKSVASLLAQTGHGVLKMAKDVGTDVVAKIIGELIKNE